MTIFGWPIGDYEFLVTNLSSSISYPFLEVSVLHVLELWSKNRCYETTSYCKEFLNYINYIGASLFILCQEMQLGEEKSDS